MFTLHSRSHLTVPLNRKIKQSGHTDLVQHLMLGQGMRFHLGKCLFFSLKPERICLMSKGARLNLKRKAIVVAACLIIAVVAVAAFIVNSQENPSLLAYTAQAQKNLDNAYGAWEEIRNGTIPLVDLEVVTRQWAINTWGKGYAQQDMQSILMQQNIYRGLFMISEDRSLYQADVAWTGNFVAATWEGKIYVEKENYNPWNLPDAEATFVHELTHIWQPNLPSPTTFDEDKARTALIEGDATFMADTYENLTKAGMLKATTPATQDCLISLTLNELHPDTLSNIDYFPYVQGEAFVNALHQQGGFATIDQAYQAGHIPTTTAQILDPEKYFENVTAQPVNLPTPASGNWTQMQTTYGQNYNTYGEYFIQDMLGNWLPQSQAQTVSAGWTGDNFAYYEGGSSIYLFTWNIRWNSSSAANEFYKAFHDMANDAGATSDGNNQWFSNSKYLSLSLDRSSNSTFIACSTVKAAVEPSYFRWP